MMKHEFEELIQAQITESHYNIIEKVYMYHPAVGDKNTIALLYKSFGMTVIGDMLPRAERVEELERSLQILNSEVSLAREKLAKEKSWVCP